MQNARILHVLSLVESYGRACAACGLSSGKDENRCSVERAKSTKFYNQIKQLLNEEKEK